MASSRPPPTAVRASVRAMITKPGSSSSRASTAARYLPTASSIGDDLLAGDEPAALREDLVLDVDAADAGADELVHGAPHVHRVAVAGVGVAEQRDADRPRDVPRVHHDLGHAREAGVRHADQVARRWPPPTCRRPRSRPSRSSPPAARSRSRAAPGSRGARSAPAAVHLGTAWPWRSPFGLGASSEAPSCR